MPFFLFWSHGQGELREAGKNEVWGGGEEIFLGVLQGGRIKGAALHGRRTEFPRFLK